MSDFDHIRGGCVEGVEYLSVTAPHARKGEPLNPPHPPHLSALFDTELAVRVAESIRHEATGDERRAAPPPMAGVAPKQDSPHSPHSHPQVSTGRPNSPSASEARNGNSPHSPNGTADSPLERWMSWEDEEASQASLEYGASPDELEEVL